MKAVKLPSGNWRIQVYLGKTEDGKKIRKSFTWENRKQVEAEAHQFLISNEEVTRSDSFGVMAERFIEDRRAVLSPSTIRSYIHIAERLKTRSVSFWDGSAYSISKYDMQGVIDHLVEDGLSPKTVLNYHGFISAVLDYSEAPSPQVRLPQKKRPNLNIPDSEKVKAVLMPQRIRKSSCRSCLLHSGNSAEVKSVLWNGRTFKAMWSMFKGIASCLRRRNGNTSYQKHWHLTGS